MEGFGGLETAASMGSHGWPKASSLSVYFYISRMSTPSENQQPPKLPRDIDNSTVRLAEASDLDRMAEVATAGFSFSPVFLFQRPNFRDLAEQTINSYRNQILGQLNDPNTCVVVIERAAKKETGVVDPALFSTFKHNEPEERKDKKVIVGIACINLHESIRNPKHPGLGECFMTERAVSENLEKISQGNKNHFNDSVDGGVDEKQRVIYESATAKPKLRMKNRGDKPWKLDTLVMHPAYTGLQLASKLLQWCCELADSQAAPLWVSAAPASHSLLIKAGFKFFKDDVTSLKLPETGKKFQLWVGIRKPGSTIDFSKKRTQPEWFEKIKEQYGAAFGHWNALDAKP